MVALKWLLLSALTALSVYAQDEPTGDPTAAAAAWNSLDLGTTVDGTDDSADKRSIVHSPRTDKPSYLADPYRKLYCKAPWTKPPCATKCNRNNCFRGLLNARDGSDGKHCPKEAFGFCCAWNWFDPFTKYYGIKYGFVKAIAPYTANCEGSGDSTWDVLYKLDDACGCTLNHEVQVDTSTDYFKLRKFPPYAHACH